MNAGAAARNAASIENRTSVYGIMNGLIPKGGQNQANKIQQKFRGTTNIVIPLNPIPGLAYMKARRLLSKNPQTSGGIGKKVLLYSR